MLQRDLLISQWFTGSLFDALNAPNALNATLSRSRSCRAAHIYKDHSIAPGLLALALAAHKAEQFPPTIAADAIKPPAFARITPTFAPHLQVHAV
jgi:hypothetical protein